MQINHLERHAMVKIFIQVVVRANKVLDTIGGGALIGMMLLTVLDVILRYFGSAIIGTYEIVSMLGGVVIGCALPRTSWEKCHVTVDLMVEKLSDKWRALLFFVTRISAMGLFFLFGWNLIKMARDYYKAGESSLTLTIPLYPLVFALGICCLIECMVLLGEVLNGAYRVERNE
jgi:TRAP-type C4-dicarboxylate transport system permease small subunit